MGFPGQYNENFSQQQGFTKNTQNYYKPQLIQIRCPQCGASPDVDNRLDFLLPILWKQGYVDESEFQLLNVSDLYNKQGNFSIEMQCISEGTHYLWVYSNYDLYKDGENASGFEIPVRKLNQNDGKIVYVSTYSGEKYHSSSAHAGENWAATTLLDAISAGYEPCGVCYWIKMVYMYRSLKERVYPVRDSKSDVLVLFSLK